ncbi:hypothetical protein HII31_02659 [Pseudocercospora fuligena]|uniref:Uncharacterized protein n=1 Tax=Pseudocercospora fuligena TaxID=685502 RepID=A0A8H6VKQ4_9PEZI|nr:hypothetical protein HII31_02659 [Pseudocercospora fuligena]
MATHFLAKTPKQLINDQKASGKLNRGPHIKHLTITIFVVSIDGKVLLLKHEGKEEWYLPSATPSPEDQSYSKASILSLVFDALKPALEQNDFKDSLQAMDLAFEEPLAEPRTKLVSKATDKPVSDGCDLAVILTVSSIPPDLCNELQGADGHETVSFSDIENHMKKDERILGLSAEFFSRVANRARTYCKQMPDLDDGQRKMLLVNQLSVLVATEEMAGELKEDHDVLILRHMQGEDTVLLLMQVPQEECELYPNHEVIAYTYDGIWATRVGRVSMKDTSSEGGPAWRKLHMTNDWLAEDAFANDGRLMATWMERANQNFRSQSQRKEMVEYKLLTWLA